MVTAAVLIALSAGLYAAHFAIFGDAHHIFIYLLGDIAFVPLEVLLVVLVIERLISRHERRKVLRKMNMLVGTFFSEVGTELLGKLTEGLANKAEVRPRIAVEPGWGTRQYRQALRSAGALKYRFDARSMDLAGLRDFLAGKRDILLLLLANPNLLEHDRFTDLLWAVFHLQEELSARQSLDGVPDSDADHLAGDIQRVYSRLTVEWLHYCGHLQVAYPYIFSIVARTHPLQDNPDPTVS